MRPRHRQVPQEYIDLGHKVIEARDIWEDLQAEYREMTIKLVETIYLSALAANSPFSYKVLRSWVVADAEWERVPMVGDDG